MLSPPPVVFLNSPFPDGFWGVAHKQSGRARLDRNQCCGGHLRGHVHTNDSNRVLIAGHIHPDAIALAKSFQNLSKVFHIGNLGSKNAREGPRWPNPRPVCLRQTSPLAAFALTLSAFQNPVSTCGEGAGGGEINLQAKPTKSARRGKGISWSEAWPSPRKTRARPLGRRAHDENQPPIAASPTESLAKCSP
jgi:hypothetical protein